jgi:glyoxylase-like metal-dependent hydrolase (beta-lactamase superfamily II)
MTNRVYVLDTGISTLDKSLLTLNYREFGKSVKIPVLAYLIKSDRQNILVDTGFGDPERSDLKAWSCERPLGKAQEPLVQLENLGAGPDDIDIVVNTHLHNDHCGNNKLFKNSKFFVQKEELRHAFVPDDNERDGREAFCNRLDFDHSLDYHLVTGDYEIAEGVQLVYTPGHTAGHQSVIVRLRERNFVIASDAVFTEENWTKNVMPGIVYDSVAYMDSIRKLKAVRNSTIYFSHDMDFFLKSPREFS